MSKGFRKSMLNIPMDMWDKVHDIEGDYITMTPTEFLDEIGLPSSLSSFTNEYESKWIDEIYDIERNRRRGHNE